MNAVGYKFLNSFTNNPITIKDSPQKASLYSPQINEELTQSMNNKKRHQASWPLEREGSFAVIYHNPHMMSDTQQKVSGECQQRNPKFLIQKFSNASLKQKGAHLTKFTVQVMSWHAGTLPGRRRSNTCWKLTPWTTESSKCPGSWNNTSNERNFRFDYSKSDLQKHKNNG